MATILSQLKELIVSSAISGVTTCAINEYPKLSMGNETLKTTYPDSNVGLNQHWTNLHCCLGCLIRQSAPCSSIAWDICGISDAQVPKRIPRSYPVSRKRGSLFNGRREFAKSRKRGHFAGMGPRNFEKFCMYLLSFVCSACLNCYV